MQENDFNRIWSSDVSSDLVSWNLVEKLHKFKKKVKLVLVFQSKS